MGIVFLPGPIISEWPTIGPESCRRECHFFASNTAFIRRNLIFTASNDGLIAHFTTSDSSHNERHGGCLLCGAGGASDGYGVGSGWRAACRAASNGCASRLPQYVADKQKGNCIAQTQSTPWDSQLQGSEHDGRHKQPPSKQRGPSNAGERQYERGGAGRSVDRQS